MTVAFADQALYAGSNFAVQILLARWLGLEAYGGFVTAYILVLALAGLHNALIIEPMSVLAPRHDGDDWDRYLARLIALHCLLLIAFVTVTMGVGLAVTPFLGDLSPWSLPFCVAALSCHWLLRRLAYARDAASAALVQSVVYAVTIGLGLLALRASDSMTPAWGLGLIGVASVAATAVGAAPATARGFARPDRHFIADHWRLGKWGSAEFLATLVGGSAYPLIVAALGGLAAAGGFRAIQVLYLPLGHAATALSIVFLPALARHRARNGDAAFFSMGRQLLGLYAVMAGVYLAVMIPLGPRLAEFAYGDGDVLQWLWLLPIVGGVAALGALSASLIAILRAAEQPRLIWWSQAARAALTPTLSLVLAVSFGVRGLAIGLLIGAAVGSALLAWFMRKRAALAMSERNF